MNHVPKPPELKSCVDCPIWPPGTQTGFPTSEKIQHCINHVFQGRRLWLTAEEFLAQVEAHRQKRLQEPLKATGPFQPGPFVRTYVLDWSLQYKPKRPVLIIPEDLP